MDGFLYILICYIVTGIAKVAAHSPIPASTMAYYGHKYVSRYLAAWSLQWDLIRSRHSKG
ncbi:hypothetical protein DER46DRAFT_617105 [Fusarium sp. MPI-SDFR-AT-0072]|nr:hypothetical protein DER46DRAFT_617105 [Fusarium sp. MPI-SDFR-AT-0072]